eukprot:1146605-Pelagomonas_calceolata.AAC.4
MLLSKGCSATAYLQKAILRPCTTMTHLHNAILMAMQRDHARPMAPALQTNCNTHYVNEHPCACMSWVRLQDTSGRRV